MFFLCKLPLQYQKYFPSLSREQAIPSESFANPALELALIQENPKFADI
ncbi:hypothetical protein [Nostoc sp.]